MEKYYLDTTVINHAITQQDPILHEASLKFLELLKKGEFRGYTSDLVIQEIMKAPGPKAAQLREAMNALALEELEITKEIEALAEKYIEFGVIPPNYINDALHIAIATFYDMDAIITWNFEHMVKKKTKKEVPLINSVEGYKGIDIYTPLEVI